MILFAAFLCSVATAEESPAQETAPAGFAELPKHPSELEFRNLEFEIQRPERPELDNGIRLFLMEDDELPLAFVRVLVRTGSIYEPADKIGLAELTGRVMRTGGTEDLSGDEIDEELEFLAASVETSIGREMGSASVDCLSKDLDRCLEILAGVLRRPAFPLEKLELERARVEERIRRRNDDPQAVASREIALAVYGRESPWARIPSMATVDSVTREDLVAFHQRYFHPNNIMVGVAGDFDRGHLLEKLEGVFGDWPVQEVDFPEVPPVDREIERRVVYIPKDINQANIRLGDFGYNRLNPDRFAIEVMNFIYGAGGFSSRLMTEIRSDMGLAYAVWGYVGRGTDVGLYQAGAETRTESALRTIEEMLRITGEMREKPVSREERDRAVDSMANRFVFLYDSPSKIVSQYMDLEYYGYPEDFLDTYLENLRAVTTEDVEAAARKYLHPDRAIVLLVGNREDLDGNLDQFGPVEVHELEEE